MDDNSNRVTTAEGLVGSIEYSQDTDSFTFKNIGKKEVKPT